MLSKGDQLKCDVCGAVCVVNEPCNCVDCTILCCGKPMKISKTPAIKTVKVAKAAKSATKTVKKKAVKTVKKKAAKKKK